MVSFDTSDDAGVFRLSGDLCLIQTADFITPIGEDPFLFGQIAAANSLSDIYAMGGKPVSAINLCCFPAKGIEKDYLAQILKGGLDILGKAGAVLLGGHTIRDEELKYGMSVNGIAKLSEIKRNSTAKPGDKLVLTKPIGTGVIIHAVKQKVLDTSAISLIAPYMIQLNDTACHLMLQYEAHACTDISGFGLLGHIWELAKASGVGIKLHARSIPHYPESLEMFRKDVKIGMNSANRSFVGDRVQFDSKVSEVFQALMFDPQTSGGLLISVPEKNAEALLKDLHQAGRSQARIVGEIIASEPKIRVGV